MTEVILKGKDIVTTPIQRLLVKGDRKCDKIRFSVDRYSGGYDLSSASWYLKFEDPNNEQFLELLTSDVSATTTTKFHPLWTPHGNATALSGRLQIELMAVIGDIEETDSIVWHSKIATIYVENNLPVSTISDQTPDIFEQHLAAVQIKLSQAQAAQLAAETAESDARDAAAAAATALNNADIARAAAAAAAAFAAGYATSSDQARAAAVDAMNAAIATKGEILEILGSAEQIIQAVSDSEGAAVAAAAAQEAAEEAERQAVVAQGEAEAARDRAETARTAAEALYGSLAAVDAAKTAAQEARTAAEAARDLSIAAKEAALLAQSAANSAKQGAINAETGANSAKAGAETALAQANLAASAADQAKLLAIQAKSDAENTLAQAIAILGSAEQIQEAVDAVTEATALLGDLSEYRTIKEQAEAAAAAVELIGYGPIKSNRIDVVTDMVLDDPNRIYYGIEEMRIDPTKTVQVEAGVTLVIL